MDQRANSHGLTGAAGMVTVVTIHDLLPIAFDIRVWRAGADAQNKSLRWAGITLSATHALGLLNPPLVSDDVTMARTNLRRFDAPGDKRGVGHRHQRSGRARAVAIRGWLRWFSIASLVVILEFTALSREGTEVMFGCLACRGLGETGLVRDSEMLLNSLHPLEQVREQLAFGWYSPLGGDRFKITSKVLRRDPR